MFLYFVRHQKTRRIVNAMVQLVINDCYKTECLGWSAEDLMSGKYIDIKYKTHSLPSLHSIQNMTETSFSPQEKKNVSSFIFTFLMFLFQLWQNAILKKVSGKCNCNNVIIILYFFLLFCLDYY